ncbi:hypothetical protein [Mucilaginibacter pocheonensis]|uniref:Lipocalin-like domain-containing protein n=1 Tax=Mucilaginibacter pocheonensis TaxID=398050 RepID=A0ABU1TGW9_9SPHI|nr:hypothetical protein [Mucilaginibacter pocheonensis]MDR6944665.1 hypothetical protein [Mucilaginibacter pocheonensis]
MNIKNYYNKAVMLLASLGFIISLQSCSKDKGIIPGSNEDTNLFGAWKRTIHRTAQGDSVQTLSFYEGFLFALQTDASATPVSTVNSTYFKGTFDTNGTQLYIKLNQKLNSSDLNGGGTTVNQVFLNTSPYKISSDTLKITVGSEVQKYIKVNN